MKYLIFLIAVILPFFISGQDYFVEKVGDEYLYNDQYYTLSEIEILYGEYSEPMELYQTGKRRKKEAQIIALLGVPLLTGGGLGLASSGFNPEIVGPSLILSGGVFELFALITKRLGDRKFEQARRSYNHKMIEKHGYQSEPSLTLGVTGNGVGFVFQF